MIVLDHLEGKKIGIFGLGRSGLSLARAAHTGGALVRVYDADQLKMQEAQESGLEAVDFLHDEAWADLDLFLVSPGIPHLYPKPHPVIQKAYQHNVPLDNDISLFFQEIAQIAQNMDAPPKIIAITGSNGKSTTTALIAHTLDKLGYPVQMGGNIGRGVFDLNPPRNGEIYVLELSSYQIELAQMLAPTIAVLTNISPDHLDRHGGLGGYFKAKAKLFTDSLPRSVVDIDTPEGIFLENELRAKGARVQSVTFRPEIKNRTHRLLIKKSFLSEWIKDKQASSVDLRLCKNLPGRHNAQNIAMAFGALRFLNIAPQKITQAMESFAGLRHRCQIIGDKDGLVFVNDSKATNAEASMHALAAFENIHWILGGQAKEGGINGLQAHWGSVKQAYLIGDAAEEFSATLTDQIPFQFSNTLEEAVKAARTKMKSGDVLLLSPAAASFDQYKNFEERGDHFISLVKSYFLI